MTTSTDSRTGRALSLLIATCHCERSAAIRFRVWVATAVFLLAIVSTAQAKYSGGSGTAQNPYQIATATDLIALGETPADYDKHFILTADIDLDPNLPGRKVFDKAVITPATWTMFGLDSIPFIGVFNGSGHTISHLTIRGGDYLGLFGELGSGGQVKDLGVSDTNITGSSDDVGGLVGYNGGTVSQCYSTGVVGGTGLDVGGLVGYNGGTVSQCYSTGKVSGTSTVGGLVGSGGGVVTNCYSTGAVRGARSYVGGLVGSAAGVVTNCYSTGTVSGTGDSVGGLVGGNGGTVAGSHSTGAVTGGYYVGGLVGWNGDRTVTAVVTHSYSTGAVSGTGDCVGGLVGCNGDWNSVADCYSTSTVTGTGVSVGGLVGRGNPAQVTHSVWDMETSGPSVSAGGVGLTTAEMMDPYMLGLNGYANDPNWVLDPGRDYPRLAWEGTPGSIIPEPDIDWLEGTAQERNPYRIETAAQLILLGKASVLWDKHFVLAADIDLDPGLPGRCVFERAPIQVFTGVFNGNGHRISHLTISGENYLGLFGQLRDTASVSNLGLEAVQVNGTGDYIGGFVGYSYYGSLISSSYSTGSVSGDSSVGGLAGQSVASITTSYSTASVSGDSSVGGLVGQNLASITTSYSTGSISGDSSVGGLVGQNGLRIPGGGWPGTVLSCYSAGSVSGTSLVGGLVGAHQFGSVAGSFWDTQASGQAKSDGGTGKTTAQMQTAKTFLDVGWDFVGETKNGTEDIWWILEGKDYPRLWWEAAKK